MQEIKTIHSIVDTSKYQEIIDKYNYQEELTNKLDLVQNEFDQALINEIVLWKVNRYVKIDIDTFLLLNQINKSDTEINIGLTNLILQKLLATHGVRIALASTILRFKNPNIYQIIDQRVYRFIHPKGEELKNTKNIDETIEMYLAYLENLRTVCNKYKIKFNEADRILYLMDIDKNKEHKLRY